MNNKNKRPDLPGGEEVTADDVANGVLAGGLLDWDRRVVDLVLHAPLSVVVAPRWVQAPYGGHCWMNRLTASLDRTR